MEITLYKFKKRVNSTAVPQSGGVSVSAYLKQNVPTADSFDQSSDSYLTMPVFFLSTIDGSVSSDINAYNYVSAFGFWYWVQNIEVGIDNAFVFFCRIDVLASFRSEILASKQYISYSSIGYNEMIDDPRLTMETVNDVVQMGKGTPWKYFSVEGGGYAVPLGTTMTITGSGGTDLWYAENWATFDAFMSSFVSAAKEASEDWAAVYGAPMFAIGSMKRSIIDLTDSAFLYGNAVGATEDVNVFDGSDTIDLRRVNHDKPIIRRTVIHLENTLKDFRAGSRFSQYMIYLPFVGMIDISDSVMARATDLLVLGQLDPYNFNISYVVYAYEGDLVNLGMVGSGTGNAGVDVQFGQLLNPNEATQTIANGRILHSMASATGHAAALTAGAAIGTVICPGVGTAVGLGAAAAGGAITGGAGEILGAYLNGAENVKAGYEAVTSRQQLTGDGFKGNFGVLGGSDIVVWRITGRTSTTSEDYVELCGRPLNKVDVLSNYEGGFVQCPTPVIELDSVLSIVDILIRMMSGGIYLE